MVEGPMARRYYAIRYTNNTWTADNASALETLLTNVGGRNGWVQTSVFVKSDFPEESGLVLRGWWTCPLSEERDSHPYDYDLFVRDGQFLVVGYHQVLIMNEDEYFSTFRKIPTHLEMH